MVLLALSQPAGAESLMWMAWRPACDPLPLPTTYAFECNSDYGRANAYINLEPSTDIDVTSFEITLHGAQSLSGTVPEWWQVGPDQCREGTVYARAAYEGCGDDPWQGHALVPKISFAECYPGIALTISDSLTAPVRLRAGGLYQVCRLSFSMQGGSDPTTCSGCAEPFLWGLWATVLHGPGGDVTVNYNGSWRIEDHCLIWQGVPPAIHCGYVVQIPPLVSTRESTWGALKQIYR
jgi:hypothetical protein